LPPVRRLAAARRTSIEKDLYGDPCRGLVAPPWSYLEPVEWPQEEGLVRAGVALHAGRLLDQYAGLTREIPMGLRHEATLTICVLQSLLTNCWELYKYLGGRKHARVLSPIYEFVESLLDEADVEILSRFPAEAVELKPKAVIEHLRNALSHPTVRNTEPATTGYTSVPDGSGYITRMRFTDSPDLNGKGNLRAEVSGEPRVFTIELPLERVTMLAQCVALVLAQPALGNWDSADLVRPPE
jgi:hypothetical protein